MTVFNKMLVLALPVACTLSLGAAAMAQTSGNTMAGPGMGTPKPATSTAKSTAGSMRLPTSETFKTQAAASAHCPGDTVVWSTLTKTKTYHGAGSKYFGKTKHGGFVCKKAADSAGFRALKT